MTIALIVAFVLLVFLGLQQWQLWRVMEAFTKSLAAYYECLQAVRAEHEDLRSYVVTSETMELQKRLAAAEEQRAAGITEAGGL